MTEPLLRIQEVAAELGLTTRAIRYYEEVGLLEPAARSEGDYRLYDPSDVERLRFIKSLRDDAGFSLAQIGQMLEDEAARERNRERLRQTTDPEKRHRYFEEALERVDRQIALLEAKADRIDAMIADARARRAHIEDHLGGIEHDHPTAATAEGKADQGDVAKATRRRAKQAAR
jgi:DNA-binding transcriptional MerR regulator